jgi:hypothetical protein
MSESVDVDAAVSFLLQNLAEQKGVKALVGGWTGNGLILKRVSLDAASVMPLIQPDDGTRLIWGNDQHMLLLDAPRLEMSRLFHEYHASYPNAIGPPYRYVAYRADEAPVEWESS